MSKLHIPLYVQLLAWLALNLVLIGVLFFVFAAHNQTGWNLLLTQSVRDRLEAIGQSVAADLYDVPQSDWGRCWHGMGLRMGCGLRRGGSGGPTRGWAYGAAAGCGRTSWAAAG